MTVCERPRSVCFCETCITNRCEGSNKRVDPNQLNGFGDVVCSVCGRLLGTYSDDWYRRCVAFHLNEGE